jgi:hypothetical protein
MKLSQEQLEFFQREGWLFLPELFSPEEVDLLAREAKAAERAALAHAQTAGRMTEERLRATDEAAA